MRNIIATFRSRTDTLRFLQKLRECGVDATTYNTPKDVMQGCGISVAFPESDFPLAKKIFQGLTNRGTYVGFFKLLKEGGRTKVFPLV